MTEPTRSRPDFGRPTTGTDVPDRERWPGEDPVVVALHPDVEPDGLPDLRFHLHEVVLAGARDIVVDASCLDELPSPVIGALLTAHRACRGRGGHVMIRYPSRRALDQLHRTGLWHVFQVESAAPRTSPMSPRRQAER